MLLCLFGFMALTATIATFAIKSGRAILSFAAAGMWILMAVTSYVESTAMWDIYYGLFMLCGIMVFACALMASTGREKEEAEEDDGIDEVDRPLYESLKKDEEDRGRLDKLFGSRTRRPRRRLSRFARTGKE